MSWFSNPLKPRRDNSVERLIHQADACVVGLDALLEFVRAPNEATARVVRDAEERGDRSGGC